MGVDLFVFGGGDVLCVDIVDIFCCFDFVRDDVLGLWVFGYGFVGFWS